MQDGPLVLTGFLERAERLFHRNTVRTATAAGPQAGLEELTYGQWAERTRRLAGALDQLQVPVGAAVATFGWNTSRHLELYFGVPCSGRVVHTVNIRVGPEQFRFIMEDGEAEVLFVDRSLLPVIEPRLHTLDRLRHIVVMDDGAPIPITEDRRFVDYEDLLAGADPAELRVTDEYQAAALCHTSGTTGDPKGVVYSHRSIFLHTLAILGGSCFGMRESDIALPVVPMFHVNAWGMPHAAIASGCRLVMPGPNLAPEPLAELLESERITLTGGVPTIFTNLLPALVGRKLSLRTATVGGSALPLSLLTAWRNQTGLDLVQGWGMTETSPVVTFGGLRSWQEELEPDEQDDYRLAIGCPLPGATMRLMPVDSAAAGGGRDAEVPWDGESPGEIQVRGPWVTASYLNGPEGGACSDDGWLRTGDVATASPDGVFRIVDRTKDLIKSGGEWISSVELENLVMSHPAVSEAAVIGVTDRQWGERPVACVVLRPDHTLTRDELAEFVTGQMPKWWAPDRLQIVDEIPKTSVGKFNKKALRAEFGS